MTENDLTDPAPDSSDLAFEAVEAIDLEGARREEAAEHRLGPQLDRKSVV